MEQTFELKSFKLGAADVDCKYILSETDDAGVVTESEHRVKLTRPIHKELNALFCDLDGLVGRILNVERVKSLGVSFSGKDDNVGIVIQGDILPEFGPVKFKLPRIRYKVSERPEAAELTVFADTFVNEVYKYLFKEATEHLDIFGE